MANFVSGYLVDHSDLTRPPSGLSLVGVDASK